MLKLEKPEVSDKVFYCLSKEDVLKNKVNVLLFYQTVLIC